MSKDFDEENVVDELIAFILAGYDTTSITLSNLMDHLARYPDAQQKLHKEIDDVAGEGNPFSETVRNMPYLSACLRESQRLQPIAPVLQRRLQEDVSISGTPTVIPKGTVVIIPCFLLHRDQEQYPDPERFHPERWLTTEGDTVIPPKPGYFYGFGGGPKMCIGFQLGELVVKMATVKVLKEFWVESSREETKIVDAFVTGPEKVVVKLTRRYNSR